MSENRLRPRLHFTADRGWTNDPHGIVRVDGRWHLFFQWCPDSIVWDRACNWGHAVSDDLVRWRQVEPALEPEAYETGCWSGAAVVGDDGVTAAYTRVAGEHLAIGAVAIARSSDGMTGWTRDPVEAVVSGPPPGLGVAHFRDPQLLSADDGWVAVLGAGTADGVGAALLYDVSADLRRWTYAGVLASRPGNEGPEPTGTVWECPQLVDVGGAWLLLVSVWADDITHHVTASIGDHDGRAFTARRHVRLGHGPGLYATTTFIDEDGRVCAMSWMRERGNVAPDGSPWCGAMSLVHVLSVADDRLVVSQHPSLDAAFPVEVVSGALAAGDELAAAVTADVPWRLVAELAMDASVELAVAGAWTLVVDASGGVLRVVDANAVPLLEMPAAPGVGGRLDVVVDADILEVTWSASEGIGAIRVEAPARTNAVVRALREQSTVRWLEAPRP